MHESLNNRQIAFYLFGVIVGYGFINLPKDITENAGTGGWIVILISTLLVIIFTLIVIYLGYTFKGKTLYEYSNILVGKYISKILIILYSIYFFLIFTFITRISCETIKLIILLKTPIWLISFFMLFVVYYALTKGLTVLGRICELYGIIIIIFSLFIHTFMFTEGSIINLKPFLGIGNFLTYLKSITQTVIPFLGFEALLVIPLNEKNNKKVFYYSLGSILFIGLFYIFIVESTLALMGADDVISYNDVVLAAIRRLNLPYLEFLRRLDALFLLSWIIAIFCTITILSYSCIILIKKSFKKVNFNIISLAVLIISFVVSLIPNSFEQVQKILKFVGYSGILFSYIFPLSLFIITKVKKYDKKI